MDFLFLFLKLKFIIFENFKKFVPLWAVNSFQKNTYTCNFVLQRVCEFITHDQEQVAESVAAASVKRFIYFQGWASGLNKRKNRN